jgi:hypothetical protein
LVAIDVKVQKLLDLTDERVLRELDRTRQRLLRCRWKENLDKGREALTQAIGRIAFEAGLRPYLSLRRKPAKGRTCGVRL